MLALRVTAPHHLTADVVRCLEADPAVSALVVLRGAAVKPPGDVVMAEIAREAANQIVDRLQELGVHHEGSVHLEPVQTWISRPGFDAVARTPGNSADAVVWADITQIAYDGSELNWTYLSFMTMATIIASIAIVLDSQILVIGAMVLGPEFVPIAALGLGFVRRRYSLCLLAVRTLVVGFLVAICVTAIAALIAKALGWVVVDDIVGPRPGTAFIYTPDKWSFIVALIAAAAGVLSLTSAKVGGLSGVFISVTTVPAAGNVALGLAFGVSDGIWGSTLQLALNISGMAVAGWLTLWIQQTVWQQMSERRARLQRMLGRRMGAPASTRSAPPTAERDRAP